MRRSGEAERLAAADWRRVRRWRTRRRAGRGQGQHRHARAADDLRLADSRGVRQPVRGDRRHAAARSGRDHRRQDEHGRVRDGLVHREQRVRSDAQSDRHPSACPADRPAARRLPSPPASSRSRSARRPAARCVSRRRSAASSASSRRTGASAATGSSRSHRRSIRSASFGATVDDAALALGGRSPAYDPRDSTLGRPPVSVVSRAVRFAATVPTPLTGVTSAAEGILSRRRSIRGSRVSATARSITCARSARRCAKSRCRTPTLAIPVYYIIAPAEASSNLARFDGVRYGLRVAGDGLRGMYEATRSRASAPRSRDASCSARTCCRPATTTRTTGRRRKSAQLIARDFTTCLRRRRRRAVHADDADDRVSARRHRDPYEMYLSDIFTATANLAGVPAMSVPIGRVDGLPVGGQLHRRSFRRAR